MHTLKFDPTLGGTRHSLHAINEWLAAIWIIGLLETNISRLEAIII